MSPSPKSTVLTFGVGFVVDAAPKSQEDHVPCFFFLMKNLSSNPLLRCVCVSEIWSFLWSGGNIVPSLLTATSLQRTSGRRPRFNLVPRAFPWENWEWGEGNALLQSFYLTLYLGSYFSDTDTKGVRLTRSWLCFSRTPRVSSGNRFDTFPRSLFHQWLCRVSV